MELVSIIIVNWNRKDYLVRCLDSVKHQTYKSIEAIVVDNGSFDGSQRIVKENYFEVRLITNGSNLLFCKAQNQGIKQSKGEYVICLNNDVVLESSFVNEMVKAIGLDERIGMVSGKILSMDGKTIDSAGQFLGKSRKPIERGYREPNLGQYEKPEYIFGAGGAAPLYRRSMLEDIKVDDEYFDESYGIFYEDLDVSWRAHLLGWKGYYTPKAICYHQRGGTAKMINLKIGFLRKYDFAYLPTELKTHLVRNRYMTIVKNDSLRKILVNSPHIILYDFRLWTYICLFCPQILLETIKNLKYICSAFKKRRSIQRRVRFYQIYS